jgi:isoleucyl-tRNA synthetase
VDVYAIGEIFDLLDSFGDDLRFVLITSQARLHQGSHPDVVTGESGVGIRVSPDHSTLCGRCVSNLFGEGEARHYA